LILIDKLDICNFNNLKSLTEIDNKENLNSIYGKKIKYLNSNIKKPTLKLCLINDMLYELTKEGIFYFNLGKLSVFELFDLNNQGEIDIDTSLKNLLKIG
jgi:hypothetical protein